MSTHRTYGAAPAVSARSFAPLSTFPAVSAPAVPAVKAVPAGVSAAECPNYPFCTAVS